MGPDVTHSLTPRLFADLTDVTLADEDSNSIPADDVNRAFLVNVAMRVAPPQLSAGDCFYFNLEINRDMESIPWAHCASGNV